MIAQRTDCTRKRARDSVGCCRPQKTAWVGTSSDLSRIDDISVPRHREGEEEEVTVNQIVRARNVKGGVVLPLVWDNLDVMAYVRLGQKFLDSRRYGSLPSNGRAPRIMFGGRSCYTVSGAWNMRKEARGKVKEHGFDGIDMPVCAMSRKSCMSQTWQSFRRTWRQSFSQMIGWTIACCHGHIIRYPFCPVPGCGGTR